MLPVSGDCEPEMASYTVDWNEAPPEACRQGAVAIGNFDGVHRGHAALAAELRGQAQAVGGPAVVVTFDPHPLKLLRPEQFQPLLTSVEHRAELLQACGVDHVVILRTNAELLRLRAAEFFEQVVCRQMKARVLVEGFNFAFGRGREGNIDTLTGLCRAGHVELVIVPAHGTVEGTPISSSRVRSSIVQGDVRQAAALLNRPYRVQGLVGVGQRRGQTLGFPTANLEGVDTLIPKDGVYAVRVPLGENSHVGAANIGPNPTFGEQQRKLEVHLIDYSGDLYGQTLAVDFSERLRDTRAFAGRDQLVEQLKLDIEQARRT